MLAVEEKKKETSIKLTEDTTVKKQNDDWLINAIIQSYTQLKQDFQAKTQSQQVQRITSLGFTTFEESAQIQYISNLQGAYFNNYA